MVTTHADGEDFGLTVSAFASLSLVPAMVLVSIESNSKSLPHLVPGRSIGISVLSEEQFELAPQFARHGLDRFAGVEVERRSVPLLKGAAAWFEGTVKEHYIGGDHTILTVHVVACGSDEQRQPLLYKRGKLYRWNDTAE